MKKRNYELTPEQLHMVRCWFDAPYRQAVLDKEWENMMKEAEDAIAGMTSEEMEAYLKAKERELRQRIKARKVK
jgi:tripartite-type tricarboxylate transporter receptor subunit TctC